jgi:hypothetical protein
VITADWTAGHPAPVIAPGSPVCRLGKAPRPGERTEYATTKPGNGTFYLAGGSYGSMPIIGAMTIDQFVTIKPPTRVTPSLFMAGNLSFDFGVDWLRGGIQALIVFAVLMYLRSLRQDSSPVPPDMRRSGEHQEADFYDPERAKRAAFDAFDSRSLGSPTVVRLQVGPRSP